MLLSEPALAPLVYLGLTCAIYSASVAINRRTGGHPIANPVLLSICFVIATLWLTNVDYPEYFANVQLIHFLLGPAVVALAVPLFRHHRKVRDAAVPVVGSVMCGSIAGASVTLAICMAAGIDAALTASLSTKSVTAPAAMGIADQIGGAPSLAAAFSVLTGVFGAAMGPCLLNKFKVRTAMERGLAIGTMSHGIGTARILQDSEEAGAFAGIAMGMAAIAMAILLPLLARLAH